MQLFLGHVLRCLLREGDRRSHSSRYAGIVFSIYDVEDWLGGAQKALCHLKLREDWAKLCLASPA